MGTLLIIFKGIVIFEPWVGVGFGEGIVHWHYTTVKKKYTSFNCYFELTKKGLKYFQHFDFKRIENKLNKYLQLRYITFCMIFWEELKLVEFYIALYIVFDVLTHQLYMYICHQSL